MVLKAQLDACELCGDEVRITWFNTGSPFDQATMQLSRNSAQIKPQDRRIDLTFIPGVDVKPSGGEWTPFLLSTVHISSDQ